MAFFEYVAALWLADFTAVTIKQAHLVVADGVSSIVGFFVEFNAGFVVVP